VTNVNKISILDQFITNETVNGIFQAMASNYPPMTDYTKRLELLRRLRQLYSAVFAEHKLSSMQTRTDLEKALKPLLHDTRSLQQRIKEDKIQWMNKLLSVAALDSHIASSKGDAKDVQPKQDAYVPPPGILEETAKQLGYLSTLLEHLSDIVEQFDRLEPDQHLTWVFDAATEKERYVREELLPYIRKRGGIGPDTLAIVHISEIYGHIFGKPFSVVSNYDKPADQKIRGNIEAGIAEPRADGKLPQLKDLPRYSGTAVDFACAVIDALKLGGLIVPLTEDDLPPIPRDAGEGLNKAEYYDLAGMNRARAFDSESIRGPWLVNRIGDLWTNHLKRIRKSPANMAAAGQ
jgi:hypothetical protein